MWNIPIPGRPGEATAKQPSKMSHSNYERFAFEGDFFFDLVFFSPTFSGFACIPVGTDDGNEV
jgi:hypothetical protein